MRFLVIPVRFAEQDSTFSVDSLSKTFDGTGPLVTVRRYFQEQSKGALDVTFQFLPWMRTSINRDSLGFGNIESSTPTRAFLKEVVPYAQGLGQKMSDYDNDQDGLVEGLILVLAGHGNQETRDLKDPRPEMETFSTPEEPVPGVFIKKILEVVEIQGDKLAPQGIVAHELTHLLGASDLYDENDATEGMDGGVGSWDVMSSGASGKWWVPTSLDSFGIYKPIGMSAFTKIEIGWLKPREIESNQEVRLKPGEAAKLWTDSLRTTEYLLLENRDRSGVDSILPGPGLSVFRVKSERLIEDKSNRFREINSDSSNMGVEVLEASGMQRTHKYSGAQPLAMDLFGVASDSLTDEGPVSLNRPGGRHSGAWVRQVRVEGEDVVFQANPAPKRGYGLGSSGKGLGVGSIGVLPFSILVPLQIPTSGEVVAMTSALSQNSSTTCVGIWDTLVDSGQGKPLVSACDSGGFISKKRVFHHDLTTPISVKAGQTIWIGQTITAMNGNTIFTGTSVDPAVDTTWIFRSGVDRSLVTARPYVGILVRTPSQLASISTHSIPMDVRIRRIGERLKLDGALAGETIEFSFRDLRGRVLWSGSARCDALGNVAVAVPALSSGLLVLEARGSFGRRSQILSKP